MRVKKRREIVRIQIKKPFKLVLTAFFTYKTTSKVFKSLIHQFLGYVYALGGHDGLSIFDSVERYDPSSNTWTEATSMLTRR